MSITSACVAHFGPRVLRHRHARWSRERIATYQRRRAAQLVRFARARCPFYRELYRAHDTFDTLPIVDKHSVMRAFTDANSLGVTRDEVLELALKAERQRDFSLSIKGHSVGLSSGTSGEPSMIFASPREAVGYGALMRARMWPFRVAPRIALFLRSDNRVYHSVERYGARVEFFELDRVEDDLARLEAFAPHGIIAPPSVLEVLANSGVDVKLEILVAGGEVLTPELRAHLETRFDVVVREIYAAAEGIIALSCPQQRLHIQEDVALVEFEPLPDASNAARVVLTQLHRRALPIIRYRLDDLVVRSHEACPCGSAFRVLDAVEGRADQVLRLRGTNVFPGSVRAALYDVRGLDDYRVVQTDADRLRVFTDGDAPGDDVVSALERVLKRFGTSAFIDVTPQMPPIIDARAKRIRVENRWTKAQGASS